MLIMGLIAGVRYLRYWSFYLSSNPSSVILRCGSRTCDIGLLVFHLVVWLGILNVSNTSVPPIFSKPSMHKHHLGLQRPSKSAKTIVFARVLAGPLFRCCDAPWSPLGPLLAPTWPPQGLLGTPKRAPKVIPEGLPKQTQK